jgi:hypothetical protein
VLEAHRLSADEAVGIERLLGEQGDVHGHGLSFPDVAKTPTPWGPVPIPYPNVTRPTRR